jgi:phosphatidylinositol alpha-1,6-mannosyltransferase
LRIIFIMTGACATAGGIAAHNQQILRVLVRVARERSVEVTVLSFLEDDLDRPPFLPEAIAFRGFRGNKLRLALALFTRAFTRSLFVFDHVTLGIPLLPLIVAGRLRTVIFAHGSESWKRIRGASRWLFSSATLVITNSHFTLKKMRTRISRFNGVACPLGLTPEFELNARPPEPTGEPLSLKNARGEMCALGGRVCLLVGRMHPSEREKGHYELLQVWPQILSEFADAQLVFAGPGEDRESIARLACDRGVGNSVFLPGMMAHELLRRLYESCYAFTMPSRQEGFGLVYLEAMNAAKPCLGCRDGGAEEVIVDGETGLLIQNPIRNDELEGALRRLLGYPDTAREMGRRGFDRLHANFTSEHVQQRIYDQLAAIL